MTVFAEHILAEALDWVRRIQDPDFADWDAHMLWLEQDPSHPAAFDHASLLIDEAVDGLAAATPVTANDNDGRDIGTDDIGASAPPVRRRRVGWGAGLGGLAVAASLAAFLAWPQGSQPLLLKTLPGEQRSFALADGSRIMLNGDSRLRVDHATPRAVTLEQGEVLVAVAHDPAHPFTLSTDGVTFQDVGTVFDVALNPGHTDLAVREGAVMVDPSTTRMLVKRGQAVRIASGSAVLARVDPAAVGGWRDGRLRYDDAPLGEVAEDLARAIGAPVHIDRALAERRFSGVIIVDADRALMFRRIGAIAGVAVSREGAGWRIAPSAR
jgi:transmembrane sensor